MLDIEINIDEDKSAFILSGATKELLNNRRAKFYFNDNTNYEVINESIAIYFEKSQRENRLNKLKDALKKFGYTTSNSEKVRDVLKDFFEEEKKFEEFSEKARGIWNNDIDFQEFKMFKESIEKNLTNRKLYDKQLLSAFHLAFSQNACNFSVPGAGKTSVVYGAYCYLKNLPKSNVKHVNKIFIIGPLSSFGPWEDEFKECFGKKAISKRISGSINKSDKEAHFLSISDVDLTPEITLMSYQSVASNLENIIIYLKKKGNNVMVVLDEAHKIKNIDGGIWAQAVLSIAKYCKSRVVLTGTPLPNGFEDIYNLYNFIWPDKDIIKFHLFQLKDMTANRFDPRVKQLVQNLAPFFIRIKKSDLGLPKAIEHPPIFVKMGEFQRSVYEYIENSYIDYFQTKDEQAKDVTSVLTKAELLDYFNLQRILIY